MYAKADVSNQSHHHQFLKNKVMKANAPERLYLSKNIYSTYLYQVPDPDDETAVEYTRTDAFIEKACSWLKENITNNPNATQVISRKGCVTMGELIKDFRKYMERE